MADAWTVDGVIRGQASTDAAIAAVAGRQHGRITRRQLLAIGLGAAAIDWRVRRGQLHVVHRGVYAVGHAAPSREGRWMAAVLAAGNGAALSHRSAAALWRIRGGGSHPHVTGPRRRRLVGATVHRSRIASDEIASEDGIPVTTPARTLLDLAPLLPVPALARVLEAADGLKHTPGPSLPKLLQRYPRRAGAAKLRTLLRQPIARTRSDFEAEVVAWLRTTGLPMPEINAHIDFGSTHVEGDLVWRAQRLIVELDKYETHGSQAAFERDRRRDRAAQAAGWRIVRVTEPGDAVELDLRRLLGASAAG